MRRKCECCGGKVRAYYYREARCVQCGDVDHMPLTARPSPSAKREIQAAERELTAAKRRIAAIRDIDLSDLDIGDPADYGDAELATLAGYWNIGAAKREMLRRQDEQDNPDHRDDAARHAWEEGR